MISDEIHSALCQAGNRTCIDGVCLAALAARLPFLAGSRLVHDCCTPAPTSSIGLLMTELGLWDLQHN